ncbi:uncharacterized protein LOC142539505 isoform X1 [Primulina tabacum]|uniref:uncharacterized protein LOC142539505 isoform X1 n=1 Tax=Primulina tabacum TaxID=48773 RepID=UPI003F59C58E
MAISLRRALISSRNFVHTLRASSIRFNHQFSRIISSHPNSSHHFDAHTFSNSPSTNFHQFDARRSFAKGRKQQIKEEEESEEEGEEEEYDDEDDEGRSDHGNVGASAKVAAASQMDAAVDALSRELTKLRTGRASEGMLDHIMVEYYGVKTPINRMAAISVSDPKTLKVTPFDPSTLKELEKAIISSPLGLNPRSDDQQLIIPIPSLTKEHTQAIIKVVAKSSEDVKQSIRRSRQKALDSIKKVAPKKKDKDKAGSSLSEDEVKRMEKEIDDLTKKYIKKAEDMCKNKEKEIKVG